MLRVAVTLPAALPARLGGVGEYLADVTALEAAGADTIWVEDTAVEPWVILGALAAVTHRVRLGCLLTSLRRWPPSRLGPPATALQVLSRGRIVVGLPVRGRLENHVAALRSAGARILSTGARAASADGVIFAVDSADQLNGASSANKEVWAAIAAPPDREAWNPALSAYESAGVTGVIMPWNDRLIDLLRNPEPDDRTDLLISTG